MSLGDDSLLNDIAVGQMLDARENGAWHGFPNAAGRWLTIAVDGDILWTNKVKKMMYREQDIWILPPIDLQPAADSLKLPQVKCARQIALNVPAGMDVDQGWRLLFRFLSSLCWSADCRVIARARMGPGSRLIPIGGNSLTAFHGRDEFTHWPLPAPSDPEACLALALYREGRSASSDAYAYLNFYRVLDLVAEGKKSIDWIDDNFAVLKPRSPLFRDGVPGDLQGRASIGAFLYGLGRSAIAHAKRGQQYIDPDEPKHSLRLSREVVVVRELAAHAIVKHFGVPRR